MQTTQGAVMSLHEEVGKYKVFAGNTGLFVTFTFWIKILLSR